MNAANPASPTIALNSTVPSGTAAKATAVPATSIEVMVHSSIRCASLPKCENTIIGTAQTSPASAVLTVW